MAPNHVCWLLFVHWPLLTQASSFISIGPDLKPTYSSKPDPDDRCETATATICTSTLSYGILAKRAAVTQAPRIPFEEFGRFGKRAVTTATATISFCTNAVGCGVTGVTATATTSTVDQPTAHVVIPLDPMNVAGIRTAIQQQPPGSNQFWESRTDQLGTNFFFVPYITNAQANAIRNHAQVKDAYIPTGNLMSAYVGLVPDIQTEGKGLVESDLSDANSTVHERSVLSKRAETVESGVQDNMVILSWPPGSGAVPSVGDYKFDSSAGEGTYVYSCDFGATPTHPEFSEILSFALLFPGPFPVTSFRENDPKRHGSKCLSKAVGKTVGLARKARVVATVIDFNTYIHEHFLDALALIHEDIYVRGRGTKSVVNMSILIASSQISNAYQDRMGKFFSGYDDDLQVLTVA